MKRRAIIGSLAVLTTLMPFAAIGYANRIGDIVHESCVGDNRQDAKQVALWEYIIALSPDAKPGQVAAFRAYIRDTFKPADCG